jgi:enoyl-[acyl-carrier protein] reductase I
MCDNHALRGKRFIVTGWANKKSIAWAVAQLLISCGSQVYFCVRSEQRKEALLQLLPGSSVQVVDAQDASSIRQAAANLAGQAPFDGLLHAIAFANYSGQRAFHDTPRADFLQAVTLSAFSLVEFAQAFKPHFSPDASVVTLSIASEVAAENYGYMSPVKACLEGCVRFLAKSFSHDTRVRFNAVKAGPLKTSASAGIPGYLDNYLYAETLTFRKKALSTQEVAQTAVFLLSPASSGINGQGIVVDAGMSINYFDQTATHAFNRHLVQS